MTTVEIIILIAVILPSIACVTSVVTIYLIVKGGRARDSQREYAAQVARVTQQEYEERRAEKWLESKGLVANKEEDGEA